MNALFPGKVLFANGVPVAGAQVRVFDKDRPGKTDDDLTVTPGLSDAGGRFDVRFDAARYQDFNTVSLGGLGLPILAGSTTRELRVPDPTDVWLPYLEFRYTVKTQPRVYQTPLAPFRREYRLPELPPVQFVPSKHGFKFVNRFPGYPLPFSIPGLEGQQEVTAAYGLCGGMSSAAYDFVLAGRDIPTTTTPPQKRWRLHQYLYRRQIDTFASLGESVIKIARWMNLSDDTVHGTWKQTYDEFQRINARLDDQNLVVLALIYVKAADIAGVVRQIWNNHQVLAYGDTGTDTSVDVHVYDPNFPGRDDVVIHAERVQLGSTPPANLGGKPIFGFKCIQTVGNQNVKDVRGFFAMPFFAVAPPEGL